MTRGALAAPSRGPAASVKRGPAAAAGRRLAVAAVKRELRALADPARARIAASYFKTGKGEYGEGDRFLGINAAGLRAVAKAYAGLPLGEIEALLDSGIHEHRAAALLILCHRFRNAGAQERDAIVRFYLAHTARVNGWDLVDLSAPHILGVYLLDRPRAVLSRLARSRSPWERRIAILATQAFIRHGQFDDTLRLAERLLDDRHDLLHKAVGWMLREVGKRDLVALRRFLDAHAARMPRTMLRYAIERMGPAERRRHLGRRSRARETGKETR